VKVAIATKRLDEVAADAVVAGLYADEKTLPDALARFDRAAGGQVRRVLEAERFKAKGGQVTHLHANGRRLVVAGVGENLFQPPETEEMAAAIERGSADPTHGRAKLFVQFATRNGNDPEALVAMLRRPNPRRHDPATLARITCPTLVIIGDQDHAGSAKPLVDALPGATLVVLRNTEHFGTPKSIGFIDAALDFLLAD